MPTTTTNRRRILAGIPGAALAAALSPAADTLAGQRKRDRALDPAEVGNPLVLGIFQPDLPGDPQGFDKFRSKFGRYPGLVMWFQSWVGDYAALDTGLLDRVVNHNGRPMITWEPWDPAGPRTNQPDFSLAAIAAGNHDAYITSWATGLAAWNNRVYLRFGHEMNGGWYPWAVGPKEDGTAPNGNTAADYVAAWRHVHDLFKNAGATNVRWVWAPNVVYDGSADLGPLYPGDDVVDWIGMDGYNWASSKSSKNADQPWRSLAGVFGPTYTQLAAAHPDKRFMIAETACPGRSNAKAGWIRDGFLTLVPTQMPRIEVVTYFNENKKAYGANERDWRAATSKEIKAAFAQVVRSARYSGSLADDA